MLNAILFDFDGTLVDFVDADIRSLACLHARVGASVSREDFVTTAVEEIEHFHALVEEHRVDPLLMHEFRLKQTFLRWGLAWDDGYVELYRRKLLEFSTPFDGTIDLLARIRPRVRTALITNAYDSAEQRARINAAGLSLYFDATVISSEIGVYKPDPAIFRYALACLGVLPDEALFVGDSIKYDVVGAKATGMWAALFCRREKRTCDSADFIVEGIPGLSALLDQRLG